MKRILFYKFPIVIVYTSSWKGFSFTEFIVVELQAPVNPILSTYRIKAHERYVHTFGKISDKRSYLNLSAMRDYPTL